jgi:peptide deformylase
MFATNRAADGAGLAAPQVDVDLAVFVYDCLDAFGKVRLGLVCNPQISISSQPQMTADFEGCLSLPGAHVPVSRPDVALVRGQDQFGKPTKILGTGTIARCFQHETDHVNGVVMEDHLTVAERQDLRKQHERVAAEYPKNWPS